MTETEKPKTGGWSEWANRTTAVLAVLAALSSGRWGASNLQAILEQGKVNDTWAWFQADSIKERGAKQMSNLVDALDSGQSDEQSKKMAKLKAQFASDAEDKRVDKEKQKQEALEYQSRRDRMVERGFWFEISFAALQLGVILCTIAAAAKHKLFWMIGMFFGLVGLATLANGIHPIIHAPQSWYESTTKAMSQ